METLTEILGLSVHDMGNDMEKTIEQHRTEFESWAGSNLLLVDRWKGEPRQLTGEYISNETVKAWKTWKAARGIKE